MSQGLYVTRFGQTTLAASATTTVGQINLGALWAAAGKSGAGWIFLDCAYGASLNGAYFEYGRVVAYLAFDGASSYQVLEQTQARTIGDALSSVAFDVSGSSLRLRAAEANGEVGIVAVGFMSVMSWA